MENSLSVIIPNYNGKHLLQAYLPSVFIALKNSNVPYEVIVVDDGSRDDSIQFIQESYPEIKLLTNKTNRGFSYTCNQGIYQAKFNLSFLLNSDVKLETDYFKNQWQYFEKEDTFGVMGRIMSADGSKIEDAARILFYKGPRLKANKFYYSKTPNDHNVYTAYLSGANALVSTAKLKELGGFDEIFSPFSSEDSDLSTRAWLLGWKCYYEHSSVCYHQVSGSTKTQIKSDFIKAVYFRNRFLFHSIHLTGLKNFIWPFYLIIIEVLPKILAGNSWIIKSYNDYLNLLPAVSNSKKNLELLKNKYGSNLNTDDIIKTINTSLKSKTIVHL
ncbi:MAG: glycosyltransferase family 2 protein [Bacteroidota bacterium]